MENLKNGKLYRYRRTTYQKADAATANYHISNSYRSPAYDSLDHNRSQSKGYPDNLCVYYRYGAIRWGRNYKTENLKNGKLYRYRRTTYHKADVATAVRDNKVMRRIQLTWSDLM